MPYNYDFLIAAFLFLTFILFHFAKETYKRNSTTNQVTLYFILLGMLDIAFDMLSTYLVSTPRPDLTGLTFLCFTLFYVMQVVFPLSLFLYTVSLRLDLPLRDLLRRLWPFTIPATVMLLLVLSNGGTHLLFTITAQGSYEHGPWYAATYLAALVYVVFVAVDSLLHRRAYGRKKCIVIWEYLVITATCVIIQGLWNHLLVTGFGIAMGIGVLFYTVNNPSALVDNFTGFFDHQQFQTWSARMFQRRKDFHLLSIDLVQLQKSNKLFGTRIGDQMILEVTKGIRARCPRRPVFRVKGSRLVVASRNLGEHKKVCADMLDLFHTPFMAGGESFLFPAALCSVPHVIDLEDTDRILPYIDHLVSGADRNETSLRRGDHATLQDFLYQQEVEHFLPAAIREDLFHLNFQPIWSMDGQRPVTVEVLSRLRHPELGLITPDLFIPLAERRGWIVRIGLLQFRRLCGFLRDNPALLDTLEGVNVNLSPAELMTEGHCQLLLETMKEFGLPPTFFRFEITETVATEYGEVLFREVDRLLRAGVRLDLDDFGSGYANLNTVLGLPFTCVKMDRSLLAHIGEDPARAKFYRSLVTVMKDMGFRVLAEGVETREELESLSQWGVDLIQGFYFSKPLEGEALLGYLAEHK